ncbi:hypothetical protein BDEG_22262 [Batrachochytrium dendrobatidis JEL423]|uniref:BRCT domain-containing protein n=1 Tax=Batrachochytrium dendrobatidis (strain JEL423) TaxID=403673 RepID=A0A177WEX9_BATDL|nr:hypothetical protein BDEG_22262 [Batrachochytrium dendrobatidis JEL423]
MLQLLQGFVVCVSGLSEPDRNIVEQRVIELGGKFTGSFTTHVTHLISSSTSTDKYKVALELGVPIISPQWVSCLESNNDIEPFNNYLLPPFKGILVCVSGFPTEVRQEIEQRVMELGGAFTLVLSKDCTHLICLSPSGRKYEFAKEWKLDVVSIDWLNECCKQRGRVSEANFRISSVDSLDDQTAVSTDVRTYLERCKIFLGEGFDSEVLDFARKIVREGGGSMARTCDGFVSHYLLSGVCPTPIDQQRLSGLIQEVQILNYKWLTDCYSRLSLQPTEPYLYTRKNSQQLPSLNSTTQPHSKVVFFKSAIFAIDGFEETQIRAMSLLISNHGGSLQTAATATHIIVPFTNRHKPLTSLPSKSKAQLVTEYWFEASIELNQLLSPHSNVLYQPSMRKFPLRGSTFCEKFSKSCHILVCHPSLGIDSAKYIKAKEWKVKVVDGSWILSCIAEGKYMDCDQFVIPRDQTQQCRQNRDLRVLDLEADRFLTTVACQNIDSDKTRDQLSDAFKDALDCSRQKTNDLPQSVDKAYRTSQSPYSDEKKSSVQLVKSTHDTPRSRSDDYAIFAKKPKSSSKRALNLTRDLNSSEDSPNEQVENRQDKLNVVGYRDPDGLSEKQRLLEQIEQPFIKRIRSSADHTAHHKETVSTTSMEHAAEQLQKKLEQCQHQKSNQENQPVYTHSIQKPTASVLPHIQFSAIQAHQKPEMSSIVQTLGGTVTTLDTWDTKCTHLIAFSVARSEKFLCACASGKWILKPSFLMASQKLGKFVSEEDHEWCEKDPLDGAAAARYWRKEIQLNGRKGSFYGFKVLLLVEERKRNGLTTVLRCGGAQVLAAKPSLRGINEISYTFPLILQKDSSAISLVHQRIWKCSDVC